MVGVWGVIGSNIELCNCRLPAFAYTYSALVVQFGGQYVTLFADWTTHATISRKEKSCRLGLILPLTHCPICGELFQ